MKNQTQVFFSFFSSDFAARVLPPWPEGRQGAGAAGRGKGAASGLICSSPLPSDAAAPPVFPAWLLLPGNGKDIYFRRIGWAGEGLQEELMGRGSIQTQLLVAVPRSAALLSSQRSSSSLLAAASPPIPKTPFKPAAIPRALGVYR